MPEIFTDIEDDIKRTNKNADPYYRRYKTEKWKIENGFVGQFFMEVCSRLPHPFPKLYPRPPYWFNPKNEQ